MTDTTPTSTLQETPREETSFIQLLQRIRASIDHDLPPLMVRTSRGIMLAHQVDPASLSQQPPTHTRGYLPSLIGYVGLGPEKYLMWLTIQKCLRGKWLIVRVPDPAARESYIHDFQRELHALQTQIRTMPLPMIPLWLTLDVATSGLTPPGNETTIGTISTYIVAYLWSRKLRIVLHKLKNGYIEFVKAPHLAEVEQLLLEGNYAEAREALDRSDNLPLQSPLNNRFTSGNLHLAEMIQLRSRNDLEDHVSLRIKDAIHDLKHHFKHSFHLSSWHRYATSQS